MADLFDESLYDEDIFLNDIFHQKEIYKDIIGKAKSSLYDFFEDGRGIEELLNFCDTGKDFENEYYFNGLDYYYAHNAPPGLKIFNPHIAYFFSLNFNPISSDIINWEEAYNEITCLRNKYEYIFQLGDSKGYNEFEQNLDNIISPFPKTDENVTHGIIKIIDEASSYSQYRLEDNPSYLWRRHGYVNGLMRRSLEIMCEWPRKFLIKPGLVNIKKTKEKNKFLRFQELFVSPKAHLICIQHLHEFLSEDGKIWIYKKSPKTAFIALKDVLRSKRYIDKNPSMEEWISAARNTFGLEISARTFKEYNTIREAYILFRTLPTFKD